MWRLACGGAAFAPDPAAVVNRIAQGTGDTDNHTTRLLNVNIGKEVKQSDLPSVNVVVILVGPLNLYWQGSLRNCCLKRALYRGN